MVNTFKSGRAQSQQQASTGSLQIQIPPRKRNAGEEALISEDIPRSSVQSRYNVVDGQQIIVNIDSSSLTDRHTKQRKITSHFLRNLPLTFAPKFLPSLSAINNPAQANIQLFHGCPVMRATSTPSPIHSSLTVQTHRYYSTSVVYGRLWPKLEGRFYTYQRIRKLGTEFTLIAVSKASGDVFNGNTTDIMCIRIPQSERDLARATSPSDLCPLMFEQFEKRNMSIKTWHRSQAPSRKTIHHLTSCVVERMQFFFSNFKFVCNLLFTTII